LRSFFPKLRSAVDRFVVAALGRFSKTVNGSMQGNTVTCSVFPPPFHIFYLAVFQEVKGIWVFGGPNFYPSF
jgi:hypothetical protein